MIRLRSALPFWLLGLIVLAATSRPALTTSGIIIIEQGPEGTCARPGYSCRPYYIAPFCECTPKFAPTPRPRDDRAR